MDISLTLEQLLYTFERYNLDIWPMQIIAYILGITAVFFIVKRTRYSARIIMGIVAFMWLWTAGSFYMFYFGPAYNISYVFGVLFVIQGIIFLAAVFKPPVSFCIRGNVFTVLGLIFIAYAMAGYPLIGYLVGHVYPETPAFGLTPCPVTVYTYGLLLMTDKKVPVLYLVIPALWSIGGFIPVSIGIVEDIGLIIAGTLGTLMIIYRDYYRKSRRSIPFDS